MEKSIKSIIVIIVINFVSSGSIKKILKEEPIDCKLDENIFYEQVDSYPSHRNETILIDLDGKLELIRCVPNCLLFI